jgi:hypothetical protein
MSTTLKNTGRSHRFIVGLAFSFTLSLALSACSLLGNSAGLDSVKVPSAGIEPTPKQTAPQPIPSSIASPSSEPSPVQSRDSDGDGLTDAVEGKNENDNSPSRDSDGDGQPDYLDTDSDNNGLSDQSEMCPPARVLSILLKPACDGQTLYDFDGDSIPDYTDQDNDLDSVQSSLKTGLEDKVELADQTGKFSPSLIDFDGDSIPDLYDRDSDNDGILDFEDGITDNDSDGKANFRDTDSDGDNVPDNCEASGQPLRRALTEQNLPLDTDHDGIPDFLDRDSDGDSRNDASEDLNGDCLVGSNETDRLR